MREDFFVDRALHDYELYAALAERERDPELRTLFSNLAHTFRDIFDFWQRKSPEYKTRAQVSRGEVLCCRALRTCFGPAALAKYLVSREKRAIDQYLDYCATCASAEERSAMETFIDRLRAIIEQIKQR
jgi:hypothetical protein